MVGRLEGLNERLCLGSLSLGVRFRVIGCSSFALVSRSVWGMAWLDLTANLMCCA